jgi:hypothetical protein
VDLPLKYRALSHYFGTIVHSLCGKRQNAPH